MFDDERDAVDVPHAAYADISAYVKPMLNYGTARTSRRLRQITPGQHTRTAAYAATRTFVKACIFSRLLPCLQSASHGQTPACSRGCILLYFPLAIRRVMPYRVRTPNSARLTTGMCLHADRSGQHGSGLSAQPASCTDMHGLRHMCPTQVLAVHCASHR